MKIIRWFVGKILLFINKITLPGTTKRSAEDQKKIDTQTAELALYQLDACPFCIKVQREIHRLGLNIENRNIKTNQDYKEELIREGGKRTVPCLKIQNSSKGIQWMYESNDIIKYLNSRFAS